MAGKSKRNNEDNIPEGLDDLLNELTGNKNNKEDNIPEGLDDLLNEIKGKKSTATKPKRKRGRPRKKKTSPPGALTKYSKTEDVDSRILELLGLEYTFDLDYDDYANLLKEKLIEVSKGTDDSSTEDAMLLREELKKARGNKGKGTFKVKKKISKDSFTNFNVGGPKKDTTQTRKPAYGLLQGKNIAEKSQRVNDLKEEKKERKQSDNQILKSISKSLDRIIGILSKQLKFDKDQAEKQRKLEESGKRKDKENKMESAFSKGIKALAQVAGKIFSPLQDFFGKIIRFFTVVFLGKVVKKFLDWFTDPKNESKIESIGRLLKTFWPAILAGLVFLSPLGGIIAKAVSAITFGVGKLVAVIPKLIKFARANPKTAAALAAAGGAIALGARVKSEMDEDLKNQQTPTPSDPKESQSTVNSRFDMESGQGYINDKPVSLDEYNSFKNMDDSEKVQKYGTSMRGGGEVPGSGPNRDTVPAMLAPGEFVMSRGAVQRYGSDILESMNAAGGGTNIPMISNGVTYAKGGGYMNGEGKEESKLQKPRKPSKPEDKERGLDSNVVEWAKKNPSRTKGLEVYNTKTDNTYKKPKGFMKTPSGFSNVLSAGNVSPKMLVDRHSELMKSTDPKRIAAYDKKYGQGAYSQKLKQKLYKTYSSQSAGQTQLIAPKPTGQVVGRENLSPQAQKALARLDAQKAGRLQPNMQYTKNGQTISANKFNAVKGIMGAVKEGGLKGGLNYVMGGLKNMFGGLSDASNNPKSIVESMGGTVVDGNVSKPTKQEQKDFDNLAAKKEKLKQSQQKLMGLKGSNALKPYKPFSGFVKENTGMNIPGGGSDRQRIDVQPGEYVLPVDKVMKMGGPGKLDRMVANLDSNSTPARMGLRNKDISEGITPYSTQSSGEIDIETLPLSGLGGGNSPVLNSGGGTQDEFFSPISSAGLSERQRFMDTIGISAFT